MGLVFEEPTALVAWVRGQCGSGQVKSIFKSTAKPLPRVGDTESQVTIAIKLFIFRLQSLTAKVGSCNAAQPRLTPGASDHPASTSWAARMTDTRTPGQAISSEEILTFSLNLNYIHSLWPKENTFTLLSLNLSSYEEIYFIWQYEKNHVTFMKTTFIMPNSNTLPKFLSFSIRSHFN